MEWDGAGDIFRDAILRHRGQCTAYKVSLAFEADGVMVRAAKLISGCILPLMNQGKKMTVSDVSILNSGQHMKVKRPP